jgi:hypothetical protein
MLMVTACSIAFGLTALLKSWGAVAAEKQSSGSWRMPKGFLPLLSSVGAAVLSTLMLLVPLGGSNERVIHDYASVERTVYGVLLVAGFVFVVASVILSRRDTAPGSRAARIGSRLLFAINILGLIGILVSLP